LSVEDPPPGEMHFATLWESIADAVPSAPALIHGGPTTSWGAFEERSAKLAGALESAGVKRGRTVALYLHNCPEYFEIFFAALKVRAVPANVNYRYTGPELKALVENSEAEALFFDESLADRVQSAIDDTSQLKLLVQVGRSTAESGRGWGLDYERLLRDSSPAARIRRDAKDVFLSYTGGTTGLPKGVLYEIGRGVHNTIVLRNLFLDQSTAVGIVDFACEAARGPTPMSAIPASPLMHSTGFTYASLPTLTAGGQVIILEGRSFDADELLHSVEKYRAQVVAIVGDAFAVPILRALDRAAASGSRYDTSSLRTICSAGTAWSGHIKEQILEHIPQVSLFDSCGCTEGVTYGRRRTRRGDPASTANFEAAPGLVVLSPRREPLPDGELGFLAGPTPAAGYFRAPERSAAVFFDRNGETYAIPGDLGRIEPDGSVSLIGRGSTVINTGGEKVYPAEVEEVIRGVDGVTDCVVLGIPDERFGQAVAALVACDLGATLDGTELAAALRTALAGYKVPRAIRTVETVPRAPNGKIDYPAANRIFELDQ
jgi:acyl-CoA synthetase (AMP-forming)/AMP-acid ligase II